MYRYTVTFTLKGRLSLIQYAHIIPACNADTMFITNMDKPSFVMGLGRYWN